MTETQRAMIRGIAVGVAIVLTVQFALGILGGLLFFGAISRAITAIEHPQPAGPTQVASAPAQVSDPAAAPAKGKVTIGTAQEQMLKAAIVSLTDKGFQKADLMNGRYKDLITVRVLIFNTGGKDIRAIRGTMHFQDLFGRDFYKAEYTFERGLKAGQRVTDEKAMDYNPFLDSQTKLVTTSLSDMKVLWEPMAILFADGTKLGGE